MSKGLKIVLPSAVSDPEGKLRKLEHYYGIEFVRGASDGGSSKGYYRLIGDDELRTEMRFHNQIKIANVKNGGINFIYDQLNWNLDKDGNAVNTLGADDSDVMQVHTKTVYAIIGGSNTTYERFIVSDAPFTYDGDVAHEFDPYGECPDYMTLVGTKARSISGSAGTGSQGAGMGTNYSDPAFGIATGAGRPKTQYTRYQFDDAARANGGRIVSNLDIELAFAFLAIECRTKILTDIFGHGISSNSVPAADGSNWGTVSGVKLVNKLDENDVHYYGFNGTLFNIKNGASDIYTPSANLWATTNGSFPLLNMFEAQLAVSSDNSLLTPVQDKDGNVIGQGTMTGIYTKSMTFDVNCALVSGGTNADYTATVIMKVPMWRGRNRMQGNVTQWYGGYEATTSRADNESPIQYTIWRCPSIEKMVTSTTYSVAADATFDFENTYQKVAELSAPANGWCTSMLKVGDISTCIGVAGAAAINNYEGAYVYYGGPDAVGGTKYRKGSLFGNYANYTSAVVRIASLSTAPSLANTYLGSAFRVALS